MTPFVGEQQSAQAVIANQVDYANDLQPATFPTVLAQNPKIITHARRDKPYGYVDWWPISLYVNNTVKPYRQQGRALGAQLLHGPPADRRCRLVAAPAASYPVTMPSYPA